MVDSVILKLQGTDTCEANEWLEAKDHPSLAKRGVPVTLVERFIQDWLVVSTHLKNISQMGSFPQIGVKIKNIRNYHLGFILRGLGWLEILGGKKST